MLFYDDSKYSQNPKMKERRKNFFATLKAFIAGGVIISIMCGANAKTDKEKAEDVIYNGISISLDGASKQDVKDSVVQLCKNDDLLPERLSDDDKLRVVVGIYEESKEALTSKSHNFKDINDGFYEGASKVANIDTLPGFPASANKEAVAKHLLGDKFKSGDEQANTKNLIDDKDRVISSFSYKEADKIVDDSVSTLDEIRENRPQDIDVRNTINNEEASAIVNNAFEKQALDTMLVEFEDGSVEKLEIPNTNIK